MNHATQPAGVRDRLRTGLRAAMKARDMTAVTALRSALGAIDNSEAVDASRTSSVGVGDAEIDERRAAAADYGRAGYQDRAARLHGEADVAASHLPAGG